MYSQEKMEGEGGGIGWMKQDPNGCHLAQNADQPMIMAMKAVNEP